MTESSGVKSIVFYHPQCPNLALDSTQGNLTTAHRDAYHAVEMVTPKWLLSEYNR